MYWLVFNKQTRPQATQEFPGGRSVPLGPTYDQILPVAIFKCDRAEDACQAAARKCQAMGTYFAIEGTPWGVDMLEIDGVTELGVEPDEDDAKDRRIRALERTVLDREDLPQ